MNLIEHVASYMASDDEDGNEQSELLKAVYHAADEAGKASLDAAFVCLCGYTLTTLMKMND